MKYNIVKALSSPTRIPQKIRDRIRNKAIARSETRILIAGRSVEDFTEEELEVIVKEEEDKIYSNIQGKGVLAVLAILGIGWL